MSFKLKGTNAIMQDIRSIGIKCAVGLGFQVEIGMLYQGRMIIYPIFKDLTLGGKFGISMYGYFGTDSTVS